MRISLTLLRWKRADSCASRVKDLMAGSIPMFSSRVANISAWVRTHSDDRGRRRRPISFIARKKTRDQHAGHGGNRRADPEQEVEGAGEGDQQGQQAHQGAGHEVADVRRIVAQECQHLPAPLLVEVAQG